VGANVGGKPKAVTAAWATVAEEGFLFFLCRLHGNGKGKYQPILSEFIDISLNGRSGPFSLCHCGRDFHAIERDGTISDEGNFSPRL
jgi:hypothetical protein